MRAETDDPGEALVPIEGYVVDIVFDGPPSHESGRVVEVELPSGEVSVGEWRQRPDGLWALRLKLAEYPRRQLIPMQHEEEE